MRILFVNFNLGATAGINNGIAILSALLKQRGHEVQLISLCEQLGYPFDLARIKADVLGFAPGMIGLSLMEPQFKYAARLAADLQEYSQAFLICGGPHPTMDPEGVMASPGVDALCVGEGEAAICELADALCAGRSPAGIQNLWVRMPDGTISRGRLRPFVDLRALPPEDKELFDLDRLLPLKNHQLEASVGRGCLHKCTYCINESYLARYRELCDGPVDLKHYLRAKRPETALAEIASAVARHPAIRKVALVDDNVLVYGEAGEEFFRRYRTEVGLPFLCNVSPMVFNQARGEMLKAAGCDDIRFGVESGSERVKLEIMRRRISNASVVEAFRVTRELGLMSSSYNMIGLPTETREEVMQTLALNAAIQPDSIKLMTFYPFKNTPIYDLCLSLDLIDEAQKAKLDDYDTFTCLRFPEAHRLFLKKLQVAFNWYINALLANAASPRYQELVARVEAMSEPEWDAFDFAAADARASADCRRQGTLHYTKFMNRSLAAKYPSRHFRRIESADENPC